MSDFEQSINNLDLRLFEKIESQSTDHDKRSLLALQAGVRELRPQYTYLEIGSYLGGSIQPHLLDPRCSRIYSIDNRPPSQPDERGFDWRYENNSAKRMLDLLRSVAPSTDKIETYDAAASDIDPTTIAQKVDLCFIDGEHTDTAVADDFQFCRAVLANGGAIAFHDSHITYRGVAACIEQLRDDGERFRCFLLPDVIFVIEIGDFPLRRNTIVAERVFDNYHGYLFALNENDHYRRFANRFPFSVLRRLKLRVRGGNVSK